MGIFKILFHKAGFFINCSVDPPPGGIEKKNMPNHEIKNNFFVLFYVYKRTINFCSANHLKFYRCTFASFCDTLPPPIYIMLWRPGPRGTTYLMPAQGIPFIRLANFLDCTFGLDKRQYSPHPLKLVDKALKWFNVDLSANFEKKLLRFFILRCELNSIRRRTRIRSWDIISKFYKFQTGHSGYIYTMLCIKSCTFLTSTDELNSKRLLLHTYMCYLFVLGTSCPGPGAHLQCIFLEIWNNHFLYKRFAKVIHITMYNGNGMYLLELSHSYCFTHFNALLCMFSVFILNHIFKLL